MPPEVIELGPRLRAIAERVLPGQAVADLCCDHARLGAWLVAHERVPRVVAGDVNLAPLQSAAATLEALGLANTGLANTGRIELRQGSGFEVLSPGEVATAVLAGIGAPLAERLLSEAAAVGRLAGLARLVVQANHGFPKLGSLRARLGALGFGLVDEVVVRDQGRLYVILVAEPGEARACAAQIHDPRARELGPILSRGEDPLWAAWLEREAGRVARARAGMDQGRVDHETLAVYEQFALLLERAQAARTS